MKMNANLRLGDSRPDDRIHLLLWDTPTEEKLIDLAFYNNACRVNYRTNLLGRIQDDNQFLVFHHHLDRELEAIKLMCCGVSQSMILLEGFDCLITYLRVQSEGHVTLFWNNLEKTRKLEKILWILLPQKLLPATSQQNRIKRISSA